MITSKTNAKLKKIRKLLVSASERRKTGLFVIEGARLFSEVPRELVEEILVSGNLPETDWSGYPEPEIVQDSIFRSLSDTMHPQGILAVVRKPRWEEHALPERSGKYLLLDGIRDPGNLGTMIRTAEAAGVKAVCMSPDCVDLYNPKVIRSTMGSIFRVPVFERELSPVIARLKDKGIRVYAASLEAERSFREVPLQGAAVVIGSEAHGVSRPVLSIVSEQIKIPMAGRVESLNAAVSAAILLFQEDAGDGKGDGNEHGE